MRRWLFLAVLMTTIGLATRTVPHAVAAPADPPPFGTYSGTITIDTLTALGVPAEIAPGVAGTWTITFNSDGSFSASQNGSLQDTGTYTADVSTITFTDNDGPGSCQSQGGSATATYGYAWDGSTLTFTSVNDNCIGRMIVLQATGFSYTGQ
jgi:hypothetical protein